MEINEKELAVVKKEVSAIVAMAEETQVTDDNSMLAAGDVRKKIKAVGKMVKEKKESITSPLNEALKQVRSMFAPIEAMYEEAENVVSAKMLTYQRDVEEQQRKAEAEALKKLQEAQRKLEEGKITEAQVQKIEEKIEQKLEELPQIIKKSADFHTREIQKFRIINESELPREYLVPDEVKIRKAMMAGIEIKGVEYYKEKTLI